jgi:hypothetical protein
MRIASSDPRWKITAHTSAEDALVLSPPVDLSPKGAKSWVATIQGHLLGKPAGSQERAEFLKEVRKTFGYVAFLFKARRALNSYLDQAASQLEQMLDTPGE